MIRGDNLKIMFSLTSKYRRVSNFLVEYFFDFVLYRCKILQKVASQIKKPPEIGGYTT